jgi:hypothetical protein
MMFGSITGEAEKFNFVPKTMANGSSNQTKLLFSATVIQRLVLGHTCIHQNGLVP